MYTSVSDKYEVSRDGHVRNKKTKRVLHEFIGRDGYLRTQFDGKTRTIHRVVATAFVDKEPGKDFVNHIDGDKRNNNVENLEWCTRSENMRHAYDNSLRSRPNGVSNGRNKLSECDVSYIREHYIPRDPVNGALALAKRFNVAPQTICAVNSGQNWSGHPEKKQTRDNDDEVTTRNESI